MLVALVFKVTKSSSYGNPKDGSKMVEESVILNVIPSQNHRLFVKRKFNSRRKFDVFWNSLFQKYKEEELDKCFASLQLNTYRVKKAKKRTLVLLLLLDHEIRKTESNHNAFKYYSKFLNNLFACFENMVHLHQGLLRRIPTPRILFHGTATVSLPGIVKEGLHPSKAGQCWSEDKYKKPRKVCLTNSQYAAEYFALVAAEEVGGEGVVLEINVKGLEDKMRIRAETLSNGSSILFGKYFEFCFTEPIPPDRIKISYILPKLSAYAMFSYFIDSYNQSVIPNKKRHCQLQNNSIEG